MPHFGYGMHDKNNWKYHSSSGVSLSAANLVLHLNQILKKQAYVLLTEKQKRKESANAKDKKKLQCSVSVVTFLLSKSIYIWYVSPFERGTKSKVMRSVFHFSFLAHQLQRAV